MSKITHSNLRCLSRNPDDVRGRPLCEETAILQREALMKSTSVFSITQTKVKYLQGSKIHTALLAPVIRIKSNKGSRNHARGVCMFVYVCALAVS